MKYQITIHHIHNDGHHGKNWDENIIARLVRSPYGRMFRACDTELVSTRPSLGNPNRSAFKFSSQFFSTMGVIISSAPFPSISNSLRPKRPKIKNSEQFKHSSKRRIDFNTHIQNSKRNFLVTVGTQLSQFKKVAGQDMRFDSFLNLRIVRHLKQQIIHNRCIHWIFCEFHLPLEIEVYFA